MSGPVRVRNYLLATITSVYISKIGTNGLAGKKSTILSKYYMSLGTKKIVILKKA